MDDTVSKALNDPTIDPATGKPWTMDALICNDSHAGEKMSYSQSKILQIGPIAEAAHADPVLRALLEAVDRQDIPLAEKAIALRAAGDVGAALARLAEVPVSSRKEVRYREYRIRKASEGLAANQEEPPV